jgi:TPR repeat protein
MPLSRDELRLVREGAEAGDAVMQYELGRCCYTGDGVPQNYREAARLFRLAADQGDADAHYMLAVCHIQGHGVSMDMGEGERLMALGAEQGHGPSQLAVATMNRAAGGPAATVPRGAARSLAQTARSEDPETRAVGLGMLGEFADDRAFARTCCIGCGKTDQLQVCAKCLTAKFCSRECQVRMWPMHKQACKAWAEQKAAAAAEAGGASSSVQAAESGAAEAAEEDVASLPSKELKRRLDRLKISYAGVIERSELVALLEHAAERD